MQTEFDNAILQISDKIRRTLQFIPGEIKQKCEEIRLRQGLPVCLTVNGKILFVLQDSNVTNTLSQNCVTASSDDLKQTLSLLCSNSVYMHESEIKNGYISLSGGNRAGVCGVFNAEGMLISVTSVNLRIARQIFGVSSPLLPHFDGVGMLIAGPPGCGKTTILRDFVRLLSDGKDGVYRRVVVVDGRGELSGGFGGKGSNDLGVNTDVLYMKNKALGTEIALRTMFPDIIAFDEIGTAEELVSVTHCFNAGVGIITTAHCRDKGDIMRRCVTRDIVKSGAVSKVALLSRQLGASPQIFDTREFYANALD